MLLAEVCRAERDQEVEKSIELWENALAQAEAMGSDHHGGVIGVESAEGCGTRFWLRIPQPRS